MSKKNSQAGGIVYSTHPGSVPNKPANNSKLVAPKDQDLRVTVDKKLKSGKVATVVYSFQGPETALEELGGHLKKLCGVGGTAKNGEIILQGNHLEKVKAELTKLGYRYKVAGV